MLQLAEDSHLVFNGSAQAGNIECVAWVSANEWVTGAQDGSLARWSALKKKPAGLWSAAHGAGDSPPPLDYLVSQRGTEHARGLNDDLAYALGPPADIETVRLCVAQAPSQMQRRRGLRVRKGAGGWGRGRGRTRAAWQGRPQGERTSGRAGRGCPLWPRHRGRIL